MIRKHEPFDKHPTADNPSRRRILKYLAALGGLMLTQGSSGVRADPQLNEYKLQIERFDAEILKSSREFRETYPLGSEILRLTLDEYAALFGFRPEISDPEVIVLDTPGFKRAYASEFPGCDPSILLLSSNVRGFSTGRRIFVDLDAHVFTTSRRDRANPRAASELARSIAHELTHASAPAVPADESDGVMLSYNKGFIYRETNRQFSLPSENCYAPPSNDQSTLQRMLEESMCESVASAFMGLHNFANNKDETYQRFVFNYRVMLDDLFDGSNDRLYEIFLQSSPRTAFEEIGRRSKERKDPLVEDVYAEGVRYTERLFRGLM